MTPRAPTRAGRRFLIPALSALLAAATGANAQSGPESQLFSGAADISAAVAIDPSRFLAASDENNVLRLYHADRPGPPEAAFPWDAALALTDPEHVECDIEGAARLGDRIYWIGSHGRNRDGKWRQNRQRLFATDLIATTPDGPVLRPAGRPFSGLLDHLLRDPALAELDLAAAIGSPSRRSGLLAPKSEGINIEGLAPMADGRGLLIAFRNPRPRNQALLVPLLNPDAVLGAGQSPQFGPPILLDLAGMGIRDLAYHPARSNYVVVAGASGKGSRFALYQWSGRSDDPPTPWLPAHALGTLSPEAIVLFPDRTQPLLLSDDGNRAVVAGATAVRAKDTLREDTKTFRAAWLPPLPPPGPAPTRP